MTPLRIGERHEPTAGLPFVLTLYTGQRVDVHRFRTERQRDEYKARLAEFYTTDDNTKENNR